MGTVTNNKKERKNNNHRLQRSLQQRHVQVACFSIASKKNNKNKPVRGTAVKNKAESESILPKAERKRRGYRLKNKQFQAFRVMIAENIYYDQGCAHRIPFLPN